eukprot:scaffold56534_cov60-Phaeocystis_antarctica.AAC.4
MAAARIQLGAPTKLERVRRSGPSMRRRRRSVRRRRSRASALLARTRPGTTSEAVVGVASRKQVVVSRRSPPVHPTNSPADLYAR